MDFVNTFRERWHRQVETLVTPSDLAAWLVQAKLVASPPPVSKQLLADARGLREAIDSSIQAQLRGERTPRRAVQTLNLWLPRAETHPQLVPTGDGRLSLQPARTGNAAQHAIGLIALDAARMLGTGERDRIRVCASRSCSARFYDRSRSGRRVWCSMQGCGNVEKARRHRARAREAQPLG
jgi:predicted RNA-binding Zn ribbon-like protein